MMVFDQPAPFMLDSTVVMLRLFFTLLLFLIQDSPVGISSPQNGEVLRGQVEIVGNLTVPNFSSAELAFSYASHPADNWFNIQIFPQPIAGPTLAVWETNSLTDGDYNLRLRTYLLDGTFQEVIVSDLKIRNDLPEPTATVPPTDTALPQFMISTSIPVLARPSATVVLAFPSSTLLPPNPVLVTTSSIYATFARGAFIVLVIFIFFSLILRLRKNT